MVEISQASWQAGDVIAVGSSKTDRRWRFGVPKVKCWNDDTRLTGIGQVFCGSEGKEIYGYNLIKMWFISFRMYYEESAEGNENVSEILLQKESDGKI